MKPFRWLWPVAAGVLLLTGCSESDTASREWDGKKSEQAKEFASYSKDDIVQEVDQVSLDVLDDYEYEVLDAGVQQDMVYADLFVHHELSAEKAAGFAAAYEELLREETGVQQRVFLRLFASTVHYEKEQPHFVYEDGALYDQGLDPLPTNGVYLDVDSEDQEQGDDLSCSYQTRCEGVEELVDLDKLMELNESLKN